MPDRCCARSRRSLASRYRLLKPIFIRNARVRIEDHLGEILRPDIICMIVGERPGLVTAESLSAYVIYRPTLKSIEPERTVISNIHRGGIPIAQAARKIAALIDDAIKFQASGAALAQKTRARNMILARWQLLIRKTTLKR